MFGKKQLKTLAENSFTLCLSVTALVILYAIIALPIFVIALILSFVAKKAGILSIPAFAPLVAYTVAMLVAHFLVMSRISEP